jgi:hypothetical protein
MRQIDRSTVAREPVRAALPVIELPAFDLPAADDAVDEAGGALAVVVVGELDEEESAGVALRVAFECPPVGADVEAVELGGEVDVGAAAERVRDDMAAVDLMAGVAVVGGVSADPCIGARLRSGAGVAVDADESLLSYVEQVGEAADRELDELG